MFGHWFCHLFVRSKNPFQIDAFVWMQIHIIFHSKKPQSDRKRIAHAQCVLAYAEMLYDIKIFEYIFSMEKYILIKTWSWIHLIFIDCIVHIEINLILNCIHSKINSIFLLVFSFEIYHILLCLQSVLIGCSFASHVHVFR